MQLAATSLLPSLFNRFLFLATNTSVGTISPFSTTASSSYFTSHKMSAAPAAPPVGGGNTGDFSSSAKAVKGTPINLPAGAAFAVVASGCFWGVEHIFREHFKPSSPTSASGLISARVGYASSSSSPSSASHSLSSAVSSLLGKSTSSSGDTQKGPTYREVCSGKLPHAEACLLVYDPTKMNYRTLVEFFYQTHDPTTMNRQGNDRGTQYRSALFWVGEDQKKEAEAVTKAAEGQWWGDNASSETNRKIRQKWGEKGGKITTEIAPLSEWWDAEDYHQLYLHKNPSGYQCPTHRVRGFEPLKY